MPIGSVWLQFVETITSRGLSSTAAPASRQGGIVGGMATDKDSRNRLLTGLGWALFVASFPVWFGMFAVPFLPLSVSTRVLLAAILAVAGEIMFWAGGALLGTSALLHRRMAKTSADTPPSAEKTAE
jgi:hypothetical protein